MTIVIIDYGHSHIKSCIVAKTEALPRRERARQTKRRRIARAAAELFRQHGFDATTTEQIAERADVAKGTLFLYAKTKARLLLLVYEAEIEDAVAAALRDLQPDAPIMVLSVNLCFVFGALRALKTKHQRFSFVGRFSPYGRKTTDKWIYLSGYMLFQHHIHHPPWHHHHPPHRAIGGCLAHFW